MRLIRKFLLILLIAMLMVCAGVLITMRIPYSAYDEQLYKSSAQMITLFADKVQSELNDIESLSFRMLADDVLQKNLTVMKKNPPGTVAWVAAHSEVGDRVAYFGLWSSTAITLQLRTAAGSIFSQAFGNISREFSSDTQMAERAAKALGHNGRAVWLVEEEQEDIPARLFLVREIREMNNFTLDTLATLLFQVDFRSIVERYRQDISQLSSPLSCAIYAGEVCLYASDPWIRGLEDGGDGYVYMQQNGRDYLCVRFTSDNGWRYVTLVDYTGINSTVGDSVRFTMAAMVAVMVLALAVSTWLISTVMNHLKILLNKFDDTPGLEDFGDCMLTGAGGATGYFRVDWFTPDGLSSWGDGRTFILGTEGYMELSKNVDISHGRGDQVYVVNRRGESRMDAAGQTGYPFFRELLLDCIRRTERAMTQEHAFRAAELCLRAQAMANASKR